MPATTTIYRGEASSSTDPKLALAVQNPDGTFADLAVLEFRIMDLTSGTPVQVFPASGYQALDPTLLTTASPTPGHKVAKGRFYAPWTVGTSEPIGAHRIEWRWKLTLTSSFEESWDEFRVAQFAGVFGGTYATIGDVRAEGFTSSTDYPDDRILKLCALATRYVDRATGRWFFPRAFDSTNRMRIDGNDQRSLELEIPVIRLDKLFLESQGFLNPSLVEVALTDVRVYNRHLSGMVEPDDRENPRIDFIETGRVNEVVTSGLFPGPRYFPRGRQNVLLEGVFGYTEFDGTPLGSTPELIRQVATRLVARDLLLDSKACDKFAVKNKYRYLTDKEGPNSVTLQQAWLRGAFTGDPEIDQILIGFSRPPRIKAV